MPIETLFLNEMIMKAEARLLTQADVVKKLTESCPSKVAIQACDVMQAMNAKLVLLKSQRAKVAGA